MAGAQNMTDCGPAIDLLCDEDTESSCLFDGGDLFGTSDAQSRQTHVEKGVLCGSESEPSMLLSDDSVRWMMEREGGHLPRGDYLVRLGIGEVDVGLRREALDWMVKACVHHNFGELCLYLGMNYLDRFLSVYNLPVGKTWTIHLVAVASLSIAAKMDEVNVPDAVNLQVGEPKFFFEGKTIHRMEILVLNYLKWNVKPYTPLNFVEYFLQKMNGDTETPLGALITRSIQIILSTIKGIKFLEFKPSEIAVSVAAFVLGEKRDMDIDKALSSFLTVEKGRVMKCLKLIHDLVSSGATCSCSAATTTAATSKTASVANGSILSTWFCHSPNGVLEAACVSYKSVGRKLAPCPCSSETSPEKRRKLEHKSDLKG